METILEQPQPAPRGDESVSRDPAADERDLVERVRRGDTAAFGVLVERTMRRAYAVALALVGSPDDARDLSQDAYVRAFKARRQLDPERPFYPWYYQILRRRCFTFLHDRKRRREKLAGAAPWLIANARAASAPHLPERAAERAALRRRLQAAIDALPEHEREVFVLRELDGLKYKEIAALLDIPDGTVMSRLYSARRRLANDLEDER